MDREQAKGWFCRLIVATLAAAAFASGIANAQAPARVIAIANFGPHGSLDEVIAGFKEELGRNGYVEGRDIRYEYSHSNFNAALLPQVITQLEAKNPVLMLTVTTMVAQASRQLVKNANLPIVFAPVTDPIAAGLVPSWERGSARYVGASNLQDYDLVFEFARKLLPRASVVGLPYNAGDANDVANMKAAESAGKRLGVEVRTVSVDAVNDIAHRVQSLKGVDYLISIPSAMLVPALGAMATAADRMGVPIIASSHHPVQQGLAAAAMSVSWDQIGFSAAKLAVEILRGKRPAELANSRPTAAQHMPAIGAKKMAQLKLPIPDAVKGCNCILP